MGRSRGSDTPGPRAWPRAGRAAAGLLVATSRASLPLVALLYAHDTTMPPRVIAGVLLGLGALPAAAAWLLGRAFAAEVVLGRDALCVRRRDATFTIARESLAGVIAWRIPLPGAGISLRLASGARAPVGLENPPRSLVERGGLAAHPNLAYAAARRAAPLARLRHPLVRFGLFGLAPTAALFHVHQMIAWGAPLGQYYTEGLGPWLTSLASTWIATLAGIVMYASVVRAVLETPAFALTWVAPRRARHWRCAAEWLAAIAYYAGVPGYLAYRFFG